MTIDAPAARRQPRIALLDAVRGLAIIGVAIYHFGWDLSFLQFITVDVTTDPVWVAAARILAGSFLFLVGASLVLAHGQTIKWRKFWQRFAVVGGAALLISVATYIFFPDSFVFFGILHAIAISSVLALPFLRAPLIVVIVAAAAIIALPLMVQSDVFSAKCLAWIGFWRVSPISNDLVPLFPWFGVVLAGVAAMRAALLAPWRAKLSVWQGSGIVGRALVLAGRWSLVIYLIHQPLLLGVLYPLALVTKPELETRSASFLQSCQSSCMPAEGSEPICQSYCGCALDGVKAADLWAAIANPAPDVEQLAAISGVTRQCSAAIVRPFTP